MSFLNPVNEPVLRFSSTDADAPQINYASRTAGDVKAVLKACLVTGYGTTASAGWSIANEVDNVCEFVSPSAAMSDYRLGIDDSSASKTDWYYQYRDVRKNPVFNNPTKLISQINKTHGDNGWQLLVTDRGIWFLEQFYHIVQKNTSSRLTYWGQMKLTVQSAANCMYVCLGHNGSDYAYKDLGTVSKVDFHIDNYEIDRYLAISPFMLDVTLKQYAFDTDIDLFSELYFRTFNQSVVAQQVGINTIAKGRDGLVYGTREITVKSRPALELCAGYHGTASNDLVGARNYAIYLDHWEY